MTIDELIERLEECRDELGGETEVRLMTQSSWPFENAIVGIATTDDLCEPDDDGGFKPEGDDPNVVYIVEGRQLGYGTKAAWDCVRR